MQIDFTGIMDRDLENGCDGHSTRCRAYKFIEPPMIYIPILFFILTLSLSSHGATVTRTDPKVISINGHIDEETVRDVKTHFDSKVEAISISSEGGRTDSALDIADLMRKYKLSVRVIGYCMSSCANYIFIAGERKYVARNAILLWHGGQTSSTCRAKDCGFFDQVKRREQLLYLNAGVSFDLIMYSALLTTGLNTGKKQSTVMDGKTVEVDIIESEFQGWAPSSDLLREMGVKGIVGHWQWSSKKARDILNSHGFKLNSIYTGPAFKMIPKMLKN